MDEKMLDVLQKIGKRMNENNINWYLIGSGGLYLRNVPGIEKVNDLDFLVLLNDYEKIKTLFEENLVKEEENDLGKKIILDVDGVEVEICGENSEGLYMRGLDKEKNDSVELNGIKVNLFPLEGEEKCYREIGREEKADLIKSFIESKKE